MLLHKLFLLIKIIHVLYVSPCVCTDYGTSFVFLKIRVRFVKNYPHDHITRCVKKEVLFRGLDEISIHYTIRVRTRNGCDKYTISSLKMI